FLARVAPLRDKDGRPVVVLVVKATYELGPEGVRKLAAEQQPIVEADEYYGDPATSSVRYESDLAIFKPATDVLLIGSAVAPSGQPVRQLDVAMEVGPIRKTIRVFGDRSWQKGLLKDSIGEPKEFTTMPLTFENAFGGLDKTHADEK